MVAVHWIYLVEVVGRALFPFVIFISFFLKSVSSSFQVCLMVIVDIYKDIC